MFDIGSVPIDSADDYSLYLTMTVYMYITVQEIAGLPETGTDKHKKISLDNKINEDIITSDEQSGFI